MNAVDVWALPAPLDVLAWCAVLALRLLWWLLRTPTRNLGELGPGWVVAYWLAVAGSWSLGRWGADAIHKVRRGNDFWEFSPDRSAWAGSVVALIRLQVAGEAWLAGGALAAGYSSLAVLLFVGIVWRWVPVVVIVAAWLRWRTVTRRPWWTAGDDLVG